MKKFFLLFLLIFCSLAFCQTYKVIGVKDGDTVSLLMDGKEQIVRLANIDCPEKKQDYGTKAKEMVSDLCFGKMVSLQGDEKSDRNGRMIAELILPNGVNINKTLVKNGLAWHFKKYSKDNSYAQLEIEARNRKVGLWKEKNPIAPWIWRKMTKEEKASNSFAF
ncbi:thermonuclease family protein [Kaistella jeonii]|uniref:Nuclease n=1 Tax=Kaistella jeonii TaxID=266749 RepID=A0A0C1D863_9FLAO|nr:thermonuclease family protein [Kaistella jeonii]KIA90070.1 nuclease [Kaistella jeonii]SFB78240.1 Endonuclease YncB, thermonuclease family [Kaistella jeonii]VEI96344.1 Thermonuclease precursor [Kaistella jeonii]